MLLIQRADFVFMARMGRFFGRSLGGKRGVLHKRGLDRLRDRCIGGASRKSRFTGGADPLDTFVALLA